MADTVNTIVVQNNPERRVILLTNVSDGTGESGVTKIDISGLTASDGAAPKALDIEYISWVCSGMVAQLIWNHSTNDAGPILGGDGEHDFRPWGLLKDPRTDDTGDAANGDLLLTTTGHTSGDTYSILLSVRLRPSSG